MIKIKVRNPSVNIETPLEWIQDYSMLLEKFGRTCYKSENKIEDGSADSFIRKIIDLGHESVIEHLSITVRIICDRACSHQLVRHRIASYSQESQRYCDYAKGDEQILQVICPPKVAIIPPGTYEKISDGFWVDELECINIVNQRSCFWLDSVLGSYKSYIYLRDDGVPAEDARSVLPNATKTEVVTTFNLRQWRHVIRHRALNPKAQWQIRFIMSDILQQFSSLIPCVFQDLLTTPL